MSFFFQILGPLLATLGALGFFAGLIWVVGHFQAMEAKRLGDKE